MLCCSMPYCSVCLPGACNQSPQAEAQAGNGYYEHAQHLRQLRYGRRYTPDKQYVLLRRIMINENVRSGMCGV